MAPIHRDNVNLARDLNNAATVARQPPVSALPALATARHASLGSNANLGSTPKRRSNPQLKPKSSHPKPPPLRRLGNPRGEPKPRSNPSKTVRNSRP